MRTFAQLSLEVTKDLDQRQSLVEQSITFDDSDVTTSSEFTSQFIELAASATDVAFAFGGVSSASTVMIVADQEVTVKFNGTGNAAIPVRPVPAVPSGAILSQFQKFDQPGVVLWRGKVASIHLGNPSSTTVAKVFVAITGNAV